MKVLPHLPHLEPSSPLPLTVFDCLLTNAHNPATKLHSLVSRACAWCGWDQAPSGIAGMFLFDRLSQRIVPSALQADMALAAGKMGCCFDGADVEASGRIETGPIFPAW